MSGGSADHQPSRRRRFHNRQGAGLEKLVRRVRPVPREQLALLAPRVRRVQLAPLVQPGYGSHGSNPRYRFDRSYRGHRRDRGHWRNRGYGSRWRHRSNGRHRFNRSYWGHRSHWRDWRYRRNW
jgi:hypothetical protein